jgi:uncharacterized LabA/DUF88 family protein
MGIVSGGGINPAAFQRAMVFVDGTNLFYRLAAAKFTVPSLLKLLQHCAQGVTNHREILRYYLYSIQHHIDAAMKRHGADFLNGVRLVLGDGIWQRDGNVKEKGVDALLVADLVYHAASRNCDFAAVVTTDTDFVYAIKRVEDFGCRTAVIGICADIPPRLSQSCDRAMPFPAEYLEKHKLGTVSI